MPIYRNPINCTKEIRQISMAKKKTTETDCPGEPFPAFIKRKFQMIQRFVVGWLSALVVIMLKLSCRIRFHDDPRPGLRKTKTAYAYAILHGHQLGAILAAEAGTVAMVSRSADGDMLVPSLRVRGVKAVRGSTRLLGRDKGGSQALALLIDHVRDGAPGYFAVDGPRGPRGEVGLGIAKLAQATGAAVIPAIPVPRRRWILTRAWDRFQVPKPFTRIDAYFTPPLFCGPNEDIEVFCARVQETLTALERQHDAHEADRGVEAAARQRMKLLCRTEKTSGTIE
jgi:lysophospholipid acyltransferase (LPLAT)-like uncharacterized protein